MAEKKSADGKTADGVVVIKKYANRRLYNTATSAYVTLDDLARMVRDGVEFQVFDAKSNEDLTRQILTQIIFEEESRGEALLPVQFLRQLIGFYGNPMQNVLPSYLEMSLESFTRQQEQFRSQMSRALGAAPGAGLMDEAIKHNMAMFQQAMRMWPGMAGAAPTPAAEPARETGARADPLDEMRRQMDEMRAQIDRLARKD
ncbi:MAG: polyhydroxyalkanoate synthesis repressor PhaR [Brevundimonas sp.]|uniref:polyhydroxyalkanoate synthesis repressor PhaR n=1 Tax=Brevundimonas sp. TaxID=1871086 RepID=UPI0025BBC94A|nr:polyhydroxyalkanoate synthesis repressor PhaR [Brevundimonas sp.]MBX3476929.1 polyhydroxyalkanoate synthesis repressor PhaR [Brevundimonas sp.]